MRRSASILAALLPSVAGVLPGQEQTVAIKDAPTAVIQNVTARFPSARIAGVSTETVDGTGSTETLSYYEVLLVDAKKQTLELEVASDGSAILKVEKKKKGEPD